MLALFPVQGLTPRMSRVKVMRHNDDWVSGLALGFGSGLAGPGAVRTRGVAHSVGIWVRIRVGIRVRAGLQVRARLRVRVRDRVRV